MTLQYCLTRIFLVIATCLALAAGARAEDGTPPVIHCPPDLVVTNSAGARSVVVNYQAAASDNLAGVTLRCRPQAGTEFPLGTTTVQCVAHDLAGNSAACSFTVRVVSRDIEPPIAYGRALMRLQGGSTPIWLVQLLGRDNRDPNPKLFVKDSASGLVAGPFHNGDRVRLMSARGTPASQKRLAGAVAGEIRLKGEATIYGVDAAGNAGRACACAAIRLKP